MMKSSIELLRQIGIIEGISYLVLLFIAMPLKYFADLPIFVQIVGMAHGILFVLFCLILLVVWFRHRWSFISVFGAFMASLIPFGTFVLDARIRKNR
jgi:integral membrane protein